MGKSLDEAIPRLLAVSTVVAICPDQGPPRTKVVSTFVAMFRRGSR